MKLLRMKRYVVNRHCYLRARKLSGTSTIEAHEVSAMSFSLQKGHALIHSLASA